MELVKATGVDGNVSVHASGFVGGTSLATADSENDTTADGGLIGCETKEGTLALAKKALGG